MVLSFRRRPVGWQHESYRHYLAAKYGSAGGRHRLAAQTKVDLIGHGLSRGVWKRQEEDKSLLPSASYLKNRSKEEKEKLEEERAVDLEDEGISRSEAEELAKEYSKYFAGKGNFLPSHYHSAFASGLNREEYEKKLREEGREDLIRAERKETPEFVRAIKEAPVEFTKPRPAPGLEEGSLSVVPVSESGRVVEEEEERPGRRKYGVFSDNLSPGVPPSNFFSGERLE